MLTTSVVQGGFPGTDEAVSGAPVGGLRSRLCVLLAEMSKKLSMPRLAACGETKMYVH